MRRPRGGETRCWSLQIQNKMRDRVEQNQRQLRRPFPMRRRSARASVKEENSSYEPKRIRLKVRRGRVRQGGDTQLEDLEVADENIGQIRIHHMLELELLGCEPSRCEGDLLSKKICGSCQRFPFCSGCSFRSQDGTGLVDSSRVTEVSVGGRTSRFATWLLDRRCEHHSQHCKVSKTESSAMMP